MKKSIKEKNKLYKRQKKTCNPVHEKEYKTYRNQLNRIMSKAERAHYEKLLNDNKSNLKKSWQILKDVINKKQTSSLCTKFKISDCITSDSDKIAKGFNNFFINIGPTLAKKIPNDARSASEFMKNRVVEQMVVKPILESEVESIIKALKDGSPGWDAISSQVVKTSYQSFIRPLTHIVNLSLMSGVFPSELKIARVIPLFKSGDASLFSNYRPVSVLNLFSKIFERAMYSRLLDFLNRKNMLYAYQFGFS